MIYDGANFAVPPPSPFGSIPPTFQQYPSYDNYPPAFPQTYGKQAQPGFVGPARRPGCSFNKNYLFPLGLIRFIIIVGGSFMFILTLL
jgi:hypothetical protein